MQIDPFKASLGAGPTGRSTNTGALTDATSSGMGKDEFLKLLTTQLQNQDPLSPMENHEFVAQLAQFSSLEQQVQTNEQLVSIQMSQLGLANAQLADLVGKNITARGDTLTVEGGKAQPVGLELAGPARSVEVTIFDQAGNAVRTLGFGNVSGGVQSLAWDGRNNTGAVLPEGRYRMEVKATDAQGEPVIASPLTRGTVDAITFENGYPELIVGAARILPGDIVSILRGEGAAAPTTPTPTPKPPAGGQTGDPGLLTP